MKMATPGHQHLFRDQHADHSAFAQAHRPENTKLQNAALHRHDPVNQKPDGADQHGDDKTQGQGAVCALQLRVVLGCRDLLGGRPDARDVDIRRFDCVV